jgi:hypothetical protein
MSSLEEALASINNLALDTAPIIYYIEAHPRYDPLVSTVFDQIHSGIITGFTSVISLSEVLD